MAIKATIFKAELSVSDIDRSHYGAHSLTIARHPSETDERMMVRLLAYALNADDALEFGKGLSAEDEPDLVQRDLTGAIDLWVEVGLPDERDVRKAAGRSKRVVVYTYGGRASEMWWEQNREALAKVSNLSVVDFAEDDTRALARHAERTMSIDCTIQDGLVWIAASGDTREMKPLLRQ